MANQSRLQLALTHSSSFRRSSKHTLLAKFEREAGVFLDFGAIRLMLLINGELLEKQICKFATVMPLPSGLGFSSMVSKRPI